MPHAGRPAVPEHPRRSADVDPARRLSVPPGAQAEGQVRDGLDAVLAKEVSDGLPDVPAERRDLRVGSTHRDGVDGHDAVHAVRRRQSRHQLRPHEPGRTRHGYAQATSHRPTPSRE